MRCLKEALIARSKRIESSRPCLKSRKPSLSSSENRILRNLRLDCPKRKLN